MIQRLHQQCLHWLFALSFLCFTVYAQAQTPLPVTQLTIGLHVVQAEVAKNNAQRETGLMFRKEMANNAGMLFVFDQPAGICMWMKNTLIPLSVAFLDQQGKIINIEHMQPQTLDSHCAYGAAKYALEMNLNWFTQKRITAGNIVKGLPQ